MNIFNRSDDPNTLVGIILLIFLAVIAGPKVFPELMASLPALEEGVACQSLRTGENRAEHQSLLSRTINSRPESPISLEVRAGTIPLTSTANFEVTILVTNNTIAPVPLLLIPDEVMTNPTDTRAGFGIIFNSGDTILPATEAAPGGYPEDRIRLLGPRQVCLYRVQIPRSNMPDPSTFVVTGAAMRAFYRNADKGIIPVLTANQPYADQGLWIGVVESQPLPLNTSAATNTTTNP
jgi:hypothetical protein